MPQQKRRKFSLDEQDGKEIERNRVVGGSDESIGKVSGGDAGSGRDSSGSQSQPDKRSSRSEAKRAETTATLSSATAPSSVDDGKDGTAAPSSSSDGCERVSSSGRVIKQTNKGRCFTAALEAAQNKQSTSAASVAAVQGAGSTATVQSASANKPPVVKANTPVRRKQTRKRRTWDFWRKFEQDAFFEGLVEHGKDFDAIHNLLVFRSKKRGIESALIKTKEQVRYLYYRMWQKISKHVHMGSNVKKETQEIYGLVNYYAIRKVFKRLDERAVIHLNELIHKGISKVKEPTFTGKKNRKKVRVLRTPVCNALKKLNNLEGSKEDFVAEMPQQVTVELTPRCSAAWLKVHNLSHNPRVRFQVSVNRSLAGLMDFLHKKWKGPKDRLRSSLGAEEEETDELVVYPHHNYKLKPVVLAPQRATSVNRITFSSYRDNVLNSPPAGSTSAKKGSEDGKATNENSEDTEGLVTADCPKPVKSSVKINLLSKLSDPIVQVPQPPCEDENAMFPDAPFFASPSKDESDVRTESGMDCTCNESTWVVNSNCDSGEGKPTDPSPETSPHGKEKQREGREEERVADMRRLADAASKGFTSSTCKLVTLAQLSLMLDKADHIRLEYEWRPRSSLGAGSATSVGVVGDVERLTNMLRRLSSLANLEYRDILQRAKVSGGAKMSQCTLCGHLLERVTSRKKTTCDVATETLPMTAEALGDPRVVQSPRLNSNGTLVGMATKPNFVSLQTPDTDGVFRVPMPIAVPMSIRTVGPQKMSTQPTVGHLIRPPESQPPKPNFMVPRKRKMPKRPIVSGQRTLLPKIPSSHMILVPQNVVPESVVQSVASQAQPLQLSVSEALVADVQPSVSQVVLPIQPSAIVVSDVVSSAVTTLVSSVPEINTAATVVSGPTLLGENSVSSSDLFVCPLDMPILVSPTSSPVKSSQQLISNSVSPPSLSSMLDISLPAPSNQGADAADKFLDMVVDGNTGFSGLLKSPVKTEAKVKQSEDHTILNASQHNVLHSHQHSILSSSQHHSLNTPHHAILATPHHDILSTSDHDVLNTPHHNVLNTPQHVMGTPPHTLSSPPRHSPLRSGSGAQWLGGEGPDLSLSCFDSPVKKSELVESGSSVDMQASSLSLSSFLESPVKKLEPVEASTVVMPTLSVPSTSSSGLSFIPAPQSLFGDNSQDSLVTRLDMDTALQSVMIESSIDYSSKFERLAEHLADNTDASQPNM